MPDTNNNPVTGTSPVTAPQQRTLTDYVRDGLRRNARSFTLVMQQREEGEGAGNGGGTVTETETPAATPAVINTTGVAGGGLIPLNIQPVIEEVDKGVIYDKIGVNLSHNNSGEFLWPTYTAGEARIVDEEEAVAPMDIEFGKMTARPERVAARFDLTYESIMQSRGVVENIVQKALALAMRRFINRVLLTPEKVKGARDMQGPFVGCTKVTLPKNITFKAVNSLKAKLLTSDAELYNPVVVLHPATACDLEATPKDAGSGIMLIENGRLVGYPVFLSKYIEEGNIGMGDFSYQPSGFFGDIRLIVDPYSAAEKNMVRFILNIGFATKTIRQDAFVLGVPSAN